LGHPPNPPSCAGAGQNSESASLSRATSSYWLELGFCAPPPVTLKGNWINCRSRFYSRDVNVAQAMLPQQPKCQASAFKFIMASVPNARGRPENCGGARKCGTPISEYINTRTMISGHEIVVRKSRPVVSTSFAVTHGWRHETYEVLLIILY
jgi:hypothetical protein